jgi:hypothetical protein
MVRRYLLSGAPQTIPAAHKKSLDIQKAVEAFDNELAINPTTSISIQEKMASILDIIKK